LGAMIMCSAFWLYGRLKEVSHRYLAYIGLISFYMAGEYLHQSWDLAFPWMNLGNGFASFHQLIQWYEYTGVYGGTLWILLSNILIFEVIRNFKSNKKWKIISFTCAWILLPITCSIIIYKNYEEVEMP